MSNIKVTFHEMEDASQRMKQEAEDMQHKLQQLLSMVENLVADGYVTDKSAADALRKTDEELANALNK